MFLVFAVLVGLIPVVPAVIYLFQNGKTSPSQAVSRMVTGFNAFNFIVGLMAVGATAEKPESFGRALIFVGLSEGIAIYGLIISFLVLP